jgi:hypothetical protein
VQQKWVSDLVTANMIDPLSVYEVAAGGNLPSPRKMLERYMLFKTDPMAFMSKSREDDFSREALMDIEQLNRGEMPKVRDEYSDIYLKFMNNYMLGGDFKGQSDTTKKLYWVYLTTVKDVMRQQLLMMQTQMPTQEEVEAQNQQAVQQAAIEGQIAGAQPQPGQPGQSPQQGSASAQGGGGPSPADLAQQMAAQKQPVMV